MDGDRTVVGVEHPDLDQLVVLVGTEEEGNVLIVGVFGNVHDVAQSMVDVVIGDAVLVGAVPDRQLPQLSTTSAYADATSSSTNADADLGLTLLVSLTECQIFSF
jgi:hypothetical protein